MSLRCMFFGCASLPVCTSKGTVSRGVRAPMPPLFVAVLVNVEKVTKKDKYKSSDRVRFFKLFFRWRLGNLISIEK